MDNAIQSIYRDLEYAKSLIKKRKDGKSIDDAFEESEESWTFIGDDNEAEVMKRQEARDNVREAMDQSGLLKEYLGNTKGATSKSGTGGR